MIIREFISDFTKIKRTPWILLHLSLPIVITALFLAYYAFAGYRIIPDVRSFFILLQIGYPIFISIAVPVFIHLDKNINGIQNSLGLVESRSCVNLGKLFFMLFFSAISMILNEVCFCIGVNMFLDISITGFSTYASIFCIFLFDSLFIYLLHIPLAFRFGSSISVLLGISGTILAGLFENPIGDKIWPVIPWEWGVQFLKNYLGFSNAPVFPGIISMVIMTLTALAVSILWFSKWEGKVLQE